MVNVEWNDAPLAAFVHKYHGRKLVVEYTVEVFPSATEGSLKNQGWDTHGTNMAKKWSLGCVSLD